MMQSVMTFAIGIRLIHIMDAISTKGIHVRTGGRSGGGDDVATNHKV